MDTAAAKLIERARDLAPLLAEHAAEAERLRRPHDAVIAAMEEAGLFKLMVPRRHGGLELDLDTFLEVGLALAEGDASMSWVATFYIEHCWMFCQFPDALQKEVFGDRGYVLAPASIAANGLALPASGGYRLDGRWQWGTGAMHGEWAIVGARVPQDGGRPDPRFFALPISEVTIEDTWYVDGMLGTGSNDIVIEDHFVPETRTTSIVAVTEGRGPAAALHEGPLYRTPMIPILALAASMPIVGQARAAVAAFRGQLSERTVYGTRKKHAERSSSQIRLASAEIASHQAELLLRDVVRDVMARRDEATRLERARWAAAYAHVVDQSKRVLLQIAEASGAHAHFQHHPLQRAVRDANTMSSHVVFDLDARLEAAGRAALGLDVEGLL